MPSLVRTDHHDGSIPALHRTMNGLPSNYNQKHRFCCLCCLQTISLPDSRGGGGLRDEIKMAAWEAIKPSPKHISAQFF